MTVAVVDGNPDRTVLSTETRSTENQLTRTTTVHTPEGVDITEVYLEFSYTTIEYSESYRPEPPITSIKWPLRVDRSWSGSWEADVSGTYEVTVSERDFVRVGRGRVEAFLIHSETTFRGEFRGTGVIDVWVDAANGSVLKTAGELDLATQFGDYRTKFVTELDKGPDY